MAWKYMYDNMRIGFYGDCNIHFISSGEMRLTSNILSKQASYIGIYMRYQGSVLRPKYLFTSETFDSCVYVKLEDVYVIMSKFKMSMYLGQNLGCPFI